MEQVASAAPHAAGTGAGGVLAAGFGVIFLGVLLFSWAGMWGLLRIQRARGRPRTRFLAWVGAVSAAAIGIAGIFAFGFSLTPKGTITDLPKQVKAIRDTMPVELPPILERMAGGKERIKAQQEIAKGFQDNPAFIWWSLIVGTMMMCMVFGGMAGTIAWAGAMVAGRVVSGRWPLERQGDGVASGGDAAGGHHY